MSSDKDKILLDEARGFEKQRTGDNTAEILGEKGLNPSSGASVQFRPLVNNDHELGNFQRFDQIGE